MPTQQMLFIGGLHRSGTTLVERIIGEDPEVAALRDTGVLMNEGQFLQDVYPTDEELGGGTDKRGSVVGWAFNPRSHMTEHDVPDPQRTADELRAAWTPYASTPDARHLVEKSPANIMRMRYLQEVFPDCRLIAVRRHPIVYALAVRKWAPRHIKIGFGFGELVRHWLAAMDTFEQDLDHLRHVRVISFEELTHEPETVRAELEEHLELNALGLSDDLVPSPPGRYVDYWKALASASPWRPVRPLNSSDRPKPIAPETLETVVASAFGKQTVRRTIDRYGDAMRRHGYDPEVLDRSFRPQYLH